MLRGQWLDCAFRRFASLIVPGANLLASRLAWLGHKDVSRERYFFVIAGLDPAIHAGR
jgi:hypothetical protein